MPTIGIWIVLVLVGISLLSMLLFGVRSVAQGKVKPMSMAAVALPMIVLVVLGLVLGDWPTAAIYTVLIMIVVAALSMLLTSMRGIVGLK
ncbi:MAG: hypothetical protein HKN43_06825 [Rhodothermales bacterium]|nr:hypothetical protein [Rhodothermales bacterium]